MLPSYNSIRGAGNWLSSHDITILSQPVPNSSHILILRIIAASLSFLDFGGLSIIRIISTNGVPGFVISILLEKISTVGPVPETLKS